MVYTYFRFGFVPGALSVDFKLFEVGLTKDWYVLSKDAVWRGTINNRKETPHKSLDIPLLNVPGLRTELIYTDPMHTFHLGWGQDLAASGVILLAHLEYFGKGALDTRLERAYGEFVTYCSGVGRTTSCDGFSKQLFDMKLAATSTIIIGVCKACGV